MKQLLILSGKGGTGKTTITSAFIKLAKAKAYADCDVDAPNLHLVTENYILTKQSDYFGMSKAVVDFEKCISCGLCFKNCRFNAIKKNNNQYEVSCYECEGCGVCETFCPVKAISLQPNKAGELKLYKSDAVFSTASLKMGSGTSGKLVTEVKKQLAQNADNVDLAIIDGSPGIGCPVIASLSGADMVLIVTEPSLSGLSDMQRVVKTAQSFRPKIGVCINKFNTNEALTNQIEAVCRERNLPVMGKIPFDNAAVKAINNRLSIVDLDCLAGRAVTEVFHKTILFLIGLETSISE
ncbi:MAG: 4Fe-4S binding protein [Peptococcaceae bacterium]|nr:4Fe-4S binding protein [Peptococcaceae bacterium]